ncbi:MAG: leucine-rich repeat protein [Bacteroidaceae bacterium]|nr:leucine-rich repeat protein [Bacteroidaceae bacterium]
MKKFLLTLIVTMLTCIGAWAQDETVILNSGQTELSAADVEALNLEEDNILRLYYRSQQQYYGGAISLNYKSDAYGNTAQLFSNNSQVYWKDPFGDDDWGVISYTLTEADVAKLNAGIKIYIDQATFGKLTLTKPVYEDATGVTISRETLTLEFNTSETLTASVEPDGAKQSIIWSAIDGTGKVTVDENGKVTAVAAGTATVRATAKSDETKYAECVVTVNPPVGITDFTLSSTSVELLKGNKTTLTVTILPDNAADKTVTWSSDDTNVATVNNGEITAVGRGVTTITATSASINGAEPFTATATVTVKENLVPTNSDLKTSYLVGEEYTPTIALSDASLGEIAYTSDPSDVFSFADGKITALKEGTANITVTITPSSTATADNYTDTPWTKTFTVTVAKPAFGLTIAASPSTVQLGEAATVNVTPTVTLNGAATSNTDYTIEYTLEGASAGINIDEATGAVTVPATATAQQFDIVATLKPNEPTLYTGATAKTKVLVADLSAVVTVSVDANGVYTVNVPYGGASGDLLPDYPSQSDKDADYEAHVVFTGGADLQGLKNAESVKVTGLVNNSDIAKLIDMIGDATSLTDPANVCKSLDMSEATMAEPLALKADEKTWDSSSWIKDLYVCGLWYLESLALPQPKVGSTVIPSEMCALWNPNATLFQSLTIPEGWTEVGDYAFTKSDSGNGLGGLKELNLPNSITTIGKYAFQNAYNVTSSLVLPKELLYIDEYAFRNIGIKTLTSNDNTVIDGKNVVIGPHAFDGAANLESAVMPQNLVEIKEYAFNTSSQNHLTDLKLNDKLELIGAYAFSNFAVSVLDMPYNIRRIDDHAFNSCDKLEDVYFYGPAPEFVHTHAFAGASQMANNTVNDELYNGKYDPTTTRFNYQVAGVLACLLHYPKEFKNYYIDITREYEKRNPAELYQKGNDDNKYTMEGWTTEVLNAIANHPQHDPNAKVEQYVDYGVKDQYYGDNMIWPSQSQMTMGYALAQGGYKWTGEPLDANQYDPTAKYEDEHSIDKRGLYQFIVGMGNSTIGFKYEQDEWYTISLPFNMTPAEIQRIFGPQTQVCRFSKVVRETNEEEKEIRLEFRHSVMKDDLTAGTDYVGTHYNAYGGWDADNNWVEEPAFDKPGIIHHYPYMIKPSGEVDEDPAIRLNPDGSRTFNGKGFKRISGTLHHDAVTPVNHAGSQAIFAYEFCPILEAGTIKPNSYVLVNHGPKKHEYVFYKGNKNDATGEYEAGGKANQNTAYVQVPMTGEMDGDDTEPTITDWGKEDLREFFTSIPSTYAPINASLFGDDPEATSIEKVVIVCGNDGLENGKIYTIGGQLVNNKNLPAGLYIKNGKKFIVK